MTFVKKEWSIVASSFKRNIAGRNLLRLVVIYNSVQSSETNNEMEI